MIVVDANVLAHYFIQGPGTAEAASLLQADPVWVVPDLWKHEFLNVLATMGKNGRYSADLLSVIWIAATRDMEGKARTADMARALEIALDWNVSAYDAQYLALAESLGVPCVTEDGKLAKASRGRAVSIRDFLGAKS